MVPFQVLASRAQGINFKATAHLEAGGIHFELVEVVKRRREDLRIVSIVCGVVVNFWRCAPWSSCLARSRHLPCTLRPQACAPLHRHAHAPALFLHALAAYQAMHPGVRQRRHHVVGKSQIQPIDRIDEESDSHAERMLGSNTRGLHRREEGACVDRRRRST